ncbi:MAG: hypothetical protein QOK30_1301 [Nocardioidaceae bacterium]|jgi:hypothetical protein|nr:hypothetical protein [Nocardioidaceae bacterium]
MTTKLIAACVLVASLAGCSGSGSGVASDAPRETSASVRGPLLVSGSSAVGEATAGSLAGPVPADSRRPASGICEPSTGAIATVRLGPDTPDPRCIVVSSRQRLRVVNLSDGYGQQGKSITIRFAYVPPQVLKVRAATTFRLRVGNYLAPGVHDLHVSLYGGGGPEIWLK